ncbi:hypothetical protein P7K49_002029 [Saguinus oedipus]|uniref:Uncharacterized protein n=1 Tax=Saguinus oedipus TaxID=9490 RepID=A0ABQ9WG65_SAGOE|nr:hypothetical protein P7K49_002029 [Saguinus oedipus]
MLGAAVGVKLILADAQPSFTEPLKIPTDMNEWQLSPTQAPVNARRLNGVGQSFPEPQAPIVGFYNGASSQPCLPLSCSAKPLRAFFSSYLKSLPDVRKKPLSLPEKPNKEENSEVMVWREFDKQVFLLNGSPRETVHANRRLRICRAGSLRNPSQPLRASRNPPRARGPRGAARTGRIAVKGKASVP